MKFSTKLHISLISMAIGTILLSAALSYFEIRRKMIHILRSEVIGVAATASQLIKPNEVKQAKADLNDSTENFKQLSERLRTFRDVNRGKEIYVQYTYLIEPDPKNPNQIQIILDSTEGADYAPPGTIYPEGIPIGILDHLEEPFAPHYIVKDRWALFLPGYAPVFDEEGKYLATLGVSLSANSVLEKLAKLRWIILTSMGIAIFLAAILANLLSKRVTRSLSRICEGVQLIGKGELTTQIDVKTDDEFGKLAESIHQMAKGLQEKDRIKFHFSHHVSKHVMEKIVKEGQASMLEGEKKKISILFADIHNFTHLAETFPPEEVVSLLNEFLTPMIEIAVENQGTLDKFIGDGMMVEFGAPFDDESQEKHAVETAIAMQKEIGRLNEKLKTRNAPPIHVMIGIHTGEAILGNIGSEKRMEYTAIGDTVNTASRIQAAAKEKEIKILISESTLAAIPGQFQTKDLGPLTLKGKANPINVFSVEI